MNQRLILFIVSSLISITIHAQSTAIAPIRGWKMEEKSGRYRFTPPSLFAPSFAYEIMPLVADGNTDLAAWLDEMAKKDLQASGYSQPLPAQSKEQNIRGFQTLSVIVTDAGNKKWSVNYMAYTRPDHSIRYGKIIRLPANASGADLRTAVNHFLSLAKQDGSLALALKNSGGSSSSNGSSGSNGSGGSGNPNTPSGSGVNQTPGSNQSAGSNSTSSGGRPKRPGPVETPVTAPGQGCKPSDIKGLACHMEYTIGVGGMMIMKYNAYLVLNDGSIYSHPEVCPYDLDVARSRELEPKQWGTWKASGKNLIVMMPGDKKPETWEKNWFWGRPAAKNEKMKGSWQYIGGGGNTALGGGSMVVSSSSLTLNDKGQFTHASAGGGSFNGPSGDVTAYSNKEAAGTYILDGFLMELHYNNGRTERKSFYFYPDSKEVWGYGNRPYTPVDSK